MLTFELITLDGVKFSGQCYEVMLPTPEGQIAIFPNHAPVVTVTAAGIASIRKRADDPDEALEHFAIDSGMAEINERRVRLLAEQAEQSDEINQMEAQAALHRARELAAQAHDKESLADATAQVERHLARLKVAELKRRGRGKQQYK